MAGNVGSGIVHSLMAMGASALLIGSGAAPVIGALAVLAVKLNSYSSATTGRNPWDLGIDVVNPPSMPGTPLTPEGPTIPKGPTTEGPQDDREVAHLKRGADQGNANAQTAAARRAEAQDYLERGNNFYYRGEYGTALHYYSLARERGHPNGQASSDTAMRMLYARPHL